jgi:hypothetical protein
METAQWLKKAQVKATRAACPDCGAKHPVPIIWGLPSGELATPREQGLIELGGCMPLLAPEPDWRCRTCGFIWSSRMRKKGYRPAKEHGTWDPDLVEGTFRCSTDDEVASALEALEGGSRRIRASDWPADLEGLGSPGLYSCWVDKPVPRSSREASAWRSSQAESTRARLGPRSGRPERKAALPLGAGFASSIWAATSTAPPSG